MDLTPASILVPQFLQMPIKSTLVSRSAKFIELVLYAWLSEEHKTNIAISCSPCYLSSSFPLISVSSSKEIKLLPRFLSPFSLGTYVEGPSVHTWLMTNFIDHMPLFNGGESRSKTSASA